MSKIFGRVHAEHMVIVSGPSPTKHWSSAFGGVPIPVGWATYQSFSGSGSLMSTSWPSNNRKVVTAGEICVGHINGGSPFRPTRTSNFQGRPGRPEPKPFVSPPHPRGSSRVFGRLTPCSSSTLSPGTDHHSNHESRLPRLVILFGTVCKTFRGISWQCRTRSMCQCLNRVWYNRKALEWSPFLQILRSLIELWRTLSYFLPRLGISDLVL
jgi:hypothetical protein